MTFPCPYCPKEYKHKSSRNRHILKEHKDLLPKDKETEIEKHEEKPSKPDWRFYR